MKESTVWRDHYLKMYATNNSHLEILVQIPVLLHRYVVPILFVIGNLGNVINFLIFFKRSWRKNVCVFYFIICGLSNILFINSTLFGSIFTLGFYLSVFHTNIFLCKLFHYVSYLSSMYYPTLLICASFDRLLLSSQNVDTRLYSSKRLAYLFVSTNFVLWTVFSMHILVRVHIQQVDVDQYICTYDLSPFYRNFIMYSTLIISVVVLLVLIILSMLAFKNVRHIRANRSSKRNQIRTMHKKDFQLLRCLFIHNIVYLISSVVIVVGVNYTVTFDYTRATATQEAVNTFLNNFGAFLHYIPYCTSFFIFIYESRAFRQEVKHMVYKLCGKNLIITREEENQQQEPTRENPDLNNVVAVSTIALTR